MDFSVWTRRLQIVREFWHLGDLVLPVAVPVFPAGAALAVLFLEFEANKTLHLPLAVLPWGLPLVVPFLLPAVAWWLASKPAVEGMAIQQFLLGQFRYLMEPRTIIHFEGAREPQRPRLHEVAFEEIRSP